MKRKSLIIPLLLLAALPVVAQKLIAEKTTIDVGKTGYEMPVTATFEFRNKGMRRLKITEVKPDCNCTLIEYPKEDIGMGDVIHIDQ